MEKIILAHDVNPNEFITLNRATKVSLIISFQDHYVKVLFHDNCGGTSILFDNESFKRPHCLATLNELLRLIYAAKDVCLTGIPFVPISLADQSSAAQGLAELSKQIVIDFAHQELYPKMQQVIYNMLINSHEH